uniref:Uncharacterized protein n=2 Tax=Lotharella oceanica TaxID=641309 RepID=A0A7S2TLH3_9EUKA|mmetsp:Transcript_17129/g.32507  ORF Transcript_17129/g.32507 Transcript_17129/m.32507 type:complete len:146 (+) Transcript_17129:91-528(+)
MKRPLEELGIQGEDLKNSKALEDFIQYLQDKEVHEMCLYKQALKRAFVMNLDDYDDPLRDIDLSVLYPNAKEYQNLSLDPTRSHRRDQELRLNNVLNNLSLKSIEKQLDTLHDFLKVVRDDMTAQLQKIAADDDLDGGPLRLPGQ